MTPENIETSVLAVKRWAEQEIERIVYAGTRPVSACATVDAATREAAIARGNTITHAAEIAAIESASAHLIDYLKDDLG
jgi:hypothetical protein